MWGRRMVFEMKKESVSVAFIIYVERLTKYYKHTYLGIDTWSLVEYYLSAKPDSTFPWVALVCKTSSRLYLEGRKVCYMCFRLGPMQHIDG
jgi:hypothetical protein